MKIKAVIFDLDDTLYDCSGTLVKAARMRAAKEMVNAGLPLSELEAYEKQLEYLTKYGQRCDVFEMIAEKYLPKGKDKLVDCAYKAYNSDEIGGISLFPDVISTLTKLKDKGIKLGLVTSGVYSRQINKIKELSVEDYFDKIVIDDYEQGSTKEDDFLELLEFFDVTSDECVSIGDRLHSEIKVGNQMGMTTVRIRHGRFKDEKSKNELENPDFNIDNISEVLGVIEEVESRSSLKIVAIGGGTGLPTLLEGLKKYTTKLTAVVTVTDSGRSSGKLRKEMNVLPPGDIRNCLIALSNSEKFLCDLFQYRFEKGDLEGHSFGNLFIAAMSKVTGSFENALEKTSEVLKLKGKVLPSTLEDTHICAEFTDGNIVCEEANIRENKTAPVKRVFLKPTAKVYDKVRQAILDADIIVLGPGCLYSSVITNLLVEGIPEALKEATGKKVYVCNIMTQPNETDDYSVNDHVSEIEKYLGKGVLDYVIMNNNVPSKKVLDNYAKDKAFLLTDDSDKIDNRIKVIKADLVEKLVDKRLIWEKQDLLRHDSENIAEILVGL